jgi:hypothetical protein
METDRKEDWELAGPGSVDYFLRSPDVSIWSNRTAAIRPASHKTPADRVAGLSRGNARFAMGEEAVGAKCTSWDFPAISMTPPRRC